MASISTSSTSFFKVILSSTLHKGKLKIPKKFVEDHGEELAEWVSLYVPSGGSWVVGIQRESNASIWFHDGLLKFMEDNSIGIEFFITFEYRGGSKFSVLIFDSTATEIEYNCINASATSDVNQIKNTADVREDSTDDSIECFSSSTGHLFSRISAEQNKRVSNQTNNITRSYLTRRKKQMLDRDGMVEGVNVSSTPPTFAEPSKPASKLKQENNIKRCYLTRSKRQMLDRGITVAGLNVSSTPQRLSKTHDSNEDNRNIYDCSGGNNSSKYQDQKNIDGGSYPKECADERNIQAENIDGGSSSFKVTLKSYNIEHGLLAVPSEFARRNMPHSTKLIKLSDSDDNEWVVRFIRNRLYSLSQGWKQFLRDKKLMAGDVCTFERVWGDEVKLKVTISRDVK